MPKITEITIKLEYNEKEKQEGKVGPIIIERDKYKQWTVREFGLAPYMDSPHASSRGLYSGEIRLIEAFQSLIIDRWNGGGALKKYEEKK